MTEACVVLNDIHIDIMDYIKPSYCNEAQVRFLSFLDVDVMLVAELDVDL